MVVYSEYDYIFDELVIMNPEKDKLSKMTLEEWLKQPKPAIVGNINPGMLPAPKQQIKYHEDDVTVTTFDPDTALKSKAYMRECDKMKGRVY